MTTAEQIIAEHRVSYTFDGEGACTCGERVSQPDHAAHVVAALTNAGKTIVELPEADEVEHCRAHEGDDEWVTTTWKSDLAYVSTFEPDADGGPLIHMRLAPDGPTDPKHLRDFAAALLAAARVAEGGDQP
ncbi:hypothetical protein GS575_09405 [Rhodococcus hoagii]|nr:hypothetical protein [Prescottella equi]